MEDLTRLVETTSPRTPRRPPHRRSSSTPMVPLVPLRVVPFRTLGLSQTNPVCLRWAKKSLLPARLRPPAASVCLPFFKSPRREILRSR